MIESDQYVSYFLTSYQRCIEIGQVDQSGGNSSKFERTDHVGIH